MLLLLLVQLPLLMSCLSSRSIGIHTNLAALLNSKGDEHSPLSGVDLVAKKTFLLAVCGAARPGPALLCVLWPCCVCCRACCTVLMYRAAVLLAACASVVVCRWRCVLTWLCLLCG